MITLLRWLATALLRAQWGRSLAAMLSVAIGVALALAIHLVNRSALEEFAAAMASLHGDAQLQLRGRQADLPEQAFEALVLDERVALASPVIEWELSLPGPASQRLRVVGLDPMRAAALNPRLLPRATGADLLDPDLIYPSAFTMRRLSLSPGASLRLAGRELRIGAAIEPAQDSRLLAVMDIAGARLLKGTMAGATALPDTRLTRIDLRLREGVDLEQFKAQWAQVHPDWLLEEPGDAVHRLDGLSRAYRVNLNVLALVALVSGAFMVFATLSLSVRRQARQHALLTILGAPAALGRRVALTQALLIGVGGSLLGVAGGIALAWTLLRLVGGDLGGGYFAGSQPPLHLSPLALGLFFTAGVVTSLAGALVPARQLARLQPAQGLRDGLDRPLPAMALWRQATLLLMLLLAAAVLAQLPAWQGIPLAAYLAIALLVVAAVMAVPLLVRLLTPLGSRFGDALAGSIPMWLASQKLLRMPGQAGAAVAGIVASLALASAMAIMVHSFRASVEDWLGILLPADLYLRIPAADGDAALLSGNELERLSALPGLERLRTVRAIELNLSPRSPAVTLLVKDLDDPLRDLPVMDAAATGARWRQSLEAGEVPLLASPAMADLYGWQIGQAIRLPLALPGSPPTLRLVGLWRDYVRQHGSVVMARADFLRIGGDRGVHDVLLWLKPGATAAPLIDAASAALAPRTASVRSTGQIRSVSLAMFDRSFALTYVLEAVAIIGALFGVASTYSGEALARAREFGMLRHLGITRRQISTLFAVETSAMVLLAVAGALLASLAIAAILIHRVNPQSFHWHMETVVPWAMLGVSALLVLALGVLTATLATRSATRSGPILAVREDW